MVGAASEVYVHPGEREALLKEVAALDQSAEAAQQVGDQQKLLECLERALHIRRRLFSESSPEIALACRRLCEACNFSATVMLQKQNLKAAHDLLKRAEQVAEKSDVDRAITWNNLACYYRRVGKLRAAVTFLERALEVEEHNGIADAAQTHLNLCAVLSQLGRHTDALHHSQCALIRVYEVLSPLLLSGELRAPPTGGPPAADKHEQVTVLCIAYHNTAVEYEYLKNFESAACSYAEGLRWASKFLPKGHQLIGILKDSVEAVKEKGKLKPGSAALQRAAEVLEGLDAASEPTEQLGDSTTGLMTPRREGGDEDPPRDEDTAGDEGDDSVTPEA